VLLFSSSSCLSHQSNPSVFISCQMQIRHCRMLLIMSNWLLWAWNLISLAFTTIFGSAGSLPPSLPPFEDTAESIVAVNEGAEKPTLVLIWEDDYCEPNGDDTMQYNIQAQAHE
jgi:hypothetical protein